MSRHRVDTATNTLSREAPLRALTSTVKEVVHEAASDRPVLLRLRVLGVPVSVLHGEAPLELEALPRRGFL